MEMVGTHPSRDAVHIHPALSEVVDRAFSEQFSRGGGHDHHHHG